MYLLKPPYRTDQLVRGYLIKGQRLEGKKQPWVEAGALGAARAIALGSRNQTGNRGQHQGARYGQRKSHGSKIAHFRIGLAVTRPRVGII